jgi:hypothetical protein
MYEKLNESMNDVSGGVVNRWGEIVWPVTSVPEILELALTNNWIVLGGDILTLEQEYTHDNWYFTPNPQKPLSDNVQASVEKCRQFISQYVNKNGDKFLFVFSISNSFIEGKLGF